MKKVEAINILRWKCPYKTCNYSNESLNIPLSKYVNSKRCEECESCGRTVHVFPT